jgi:DNA polymerase family A
MQNIVLDFETYYDSKSGYSLSKMTTQEYILDPRFQVIGVSLISGNGQPTWHVGEDAHTALMAIDWSDAIVTAHNAMFDGGILNWHYGIHPAHVMCTMSMATASGMRMVAGGSLAALSEVLRSDGYDIPPKGTEVVAADGKRLEDFRDYELARYGEYCKDDVRITKVAAEVLTAQLPPSELRWQSLVLKCYTEPVLQLNKPLLEEELIRVMALKDTTLNAAATQHNCTPTQFKTVLMSNEKFARLLVEYGVDAPKKPSKARKDADGNPVMTWAMAKTDDGMRLLEEHPDERIQAFVAARLGNKSTIQESRLNRLIGMADKGAFPMPYAISGAHTHRLSAAGGQSVNVQNFPSGRVAGQSNAMRRAIEAPKGYTLCAVDSNQIELRIGAFIAGEERLLDLFVHGEDPYSAFASTMYNEPASVIRQGAKSGNPEYVLKRAAGKAANLGCIFGAGKVGFHRYCKDVARIPIDNVQAEEIVNLFRSHHVHIYQFWRSCTNVIRSLIGGGQGTFGGKNGTLFKFDGTRRIHGMAAPGIQLPDGMWLTYPNLRVSTDKDDVKDSRPVFVYDQSKGRNKVKTYIHGAKLFENLTQALAFAVMKMQLVLLNSTYRVVGNVHDEGIMVVPLGQEQQAKEYAEQCFAAIPEWLVGCPLKGEAGVAKEYGNC